MVSDSIKECTSCGIAFLITRSEQQHAEKRGALVPTQCAGCRALGAIVSRRTGRIKRYSNAKGYGFVQEDDGKTVFLHVSSLPPGTRRALHPGQSVYFDIEHTERGPRATNVTF